MDNFLKYWFSGFETSLDRLDDDTRNGILGECGRACSDSYPRQVFLDAKANAADDEAYFDELKKTFTELEFETIEKNREYEIKYRFCGCDLVKRGYVKTPRFCECSRGSLQYNLEGVWGEGKVEVRLLESILAGAPCCRFRVIKK